MATWQRPLRIENLFVDSPHYLVDRDSLHRFLEGLDAFPARPGILEFHPRSGYAGTAMIIVGHGFSEKRAENRVVVGGKPAVVVEASANRLLVVSDATCRSGPVEVSVGGDTARAPLRFEVLAWPKPGLRRPAPPFSFEGRARAGGTPSAGTIPPTGTVRVLVVPTYPTDLVPPNAATEEAAIVTTFQSVHTFYDQVSFGSLDVQVDICNFVALLDNADHYHRANGANGYPNLDLEAMDQLTAEAAQGAVNQGYSLDNYSVLVVLVYLPGLGVRAWGGWTQDNFAYSDGAGTAINITAANALSMVAARHDADWGRCAHEIGHSLVDPGLVLGEDIYSSDLVDPGAATAQSFDLMGSHDSHPMFSGFYMQQLAYYSGANVLELQWDRNATSREVEIVAHGATANADPTHAHLVRIKVAQGLDYYVEVRQRPPTGSGQVFDPNIPVPSGTGRQGGVVVTKAISGVLNNNQEMRLISLLHDPTVLLTGGVATDPLRALSVTVLDDQVSTNPLVCRVRIEWAQQIADTPGGDFDLSITPWGPGWETVDIWIDRQPFGSYDFTDPSGNPTGNGDEPRVNEVNRFFARVHNTGSAAATNVRLTYYIVTPPGVGDSGTWTPIQTKILSSVTANGDASEFVNWVPTAGEHTCLKVVAEQQLGEVTGGNNSAQENVFNFQPAGSSIPEPIAMPIAVRNPLDRPALVYLAVLGVPQGYRVYLPHRWIQLPPRGEAKMDLLVIPTADLRALREPIDRARKERKDGAPHVRVLGWIERGYARDVDGRGAPAGWMTPIGGVTARVEPKRLATVRLAEAEQDPKAIRFHGEVRPPVSGQKLRVDLRVPSGATHYAIVETNEQGAFSARFAPDPKAGKGVYSAQAHIFNATQLAPADSNVVYLPR